MKRILKIILCVSVILTCLVFCSCGDDPTDAVETATGGNGGEITITVVVTDNEQKEKTFEITTTEKTLGGALLSQNLISGTQGPYGLYVETVDGIKADYDKDKAYWSFYKNGEMLMAGVDQTPISDGEHYEIKYTK